MNSIYDAIKDGFLFITFLFVVYEASTINCLERKLERYDKHRGTIDSLRTEYIEWLYRNHVVAENVKVYDTIQVPVIKYIYKTKRVEEKP